MSANNDIKHILRSRLEQVKKSPDDRVWTNIERELKKRKKRRFFWLFLSGLLILGLGTSILTTILNSNTENTEIKSGFEKASDQEDPKLPILTEKNNKVTLDSLDRKNRTSKATSSAIQSTQSSAERTAIYYDQNSKGKNSKYRSELVNYQSVNYLSPLDLTSFETTLFWNNATGPIQEEAENELRELLNEVEENKDSRWSITAELIGSNYTAFQNELQKSTTLNFGLIASYRLSNKAYLRTGCRRLFLEQITNLKTDELEYLEFPLEAKYRPFGLRINPYSVTGVSLLTLQKSTYTNTLNINYPAKTSLFINLGLGVETKLIEHFYLNVEGRFNLFLKPLTSELEKHPYMMSFSMGLEYRF